MGQIESQRLGGLKALSRNHITIVVINGGQTMRIVAIVLNFFLLGTVTYLIVDNGVPSDGVWLLVMVIAAPICSIIALLGSRGDGWLALYFKRKALEEKKKIKSLNDAQI